jgi:hypothetical protein
VLWAGWRGCQAEDCRRSWSCCKPSNPWAE